ncbi:SDR family NAD(P)-dependent oxidoreductase [Paenibacillus nasutitermitis]|uniref:Short-chain dehydrogenase n=1 Tax=Paenibacillus nasutitermitis TaxID=1652958 RepID=A0A916Z4P8_9BACL|nr:SDR family oxidoreductase [Paenibacillus nasutitermitis]GGD75997.1 short-chain dehydrogenase [Paenibacillus nasutitermitis]
MDLAGKNVIIYGGGGAVGGAVARLFSQQGATIYLASRTAHKMEMVAEDIRRSGGEVHTSIVNALDEQAVQEHADWVAEEAGGIHIALNAIAVAHNQFKPSVELTLEEFELPVTAYIRSTFLISKSAARHMKKARTGVILHVTTPASRMAGPGFVGHSVACAGVEAISRNLAGELAKDGIRSVCIRSHMIPEAISMNSHSKDMFEENAAMAGITLDQMLEGAAGSTLLNRLPTLNEIAETALFLASDRAGAMTGTVTNLSGGFLLD